MILRPGPLRMVDSSGRRLFDPRSRLAQRGFIIDPYRFVVVASGFDTVNKPATYTLSNSNRTVYSTSTSAATAAVSLTGHSTGKYYFEILLVTHPVTTIGVSKSAPANAIQEQPGDSVNSWGYFVNGSGKYHSGSVTAYGSASANGDVIGCAVDFDNSKIFMSKNNTWQSSGDPVAGTNAMYTDINGTCRIVLNCYSVAGTSGTLNSTAAQQTYSPPSGYSAWE